MRKDVAVSLLLTLAAAQSYENNLFGRDLNSIEAREAYDAGSLDEFDLGARDAEVDNILGGVSNVLALRDLHQQELANLNTVLRRDLEQLSSEDLAALQARDPIFGKIFRGVKNVLGFRDLHTRDVEKLGLVARGLEELDARDLEELEARDPIFGKIFRGVKNVLGFRDLHARDLELLGQDISALNTRDLEMIEARDPIFGTIFRGVKKIIGMRDLQTRDVDDISNYLQAREASELSERDPEALIGLLAPFVKPLIKTVGGALGSGSQRQPRKRDLEDINDYLVTREASELSERDPEALIGLLAPFVKPLIKTVGGALGSGSQRQPRRRDLEDISNYLAAREAMELSGRDADALPFNAAKYYTFPKPGRGGPMPRVANRNHVTESQNSNQKREVDLEARDWEDPEIFAW